MRRIISQTARRSNPLKENNMNGLFHSPKKQEDKFLLKKSVVNTKQQEEL
jgi:hypothetical protein